MKPIDNWRDGWRFWSVRLQAVGVFILGLLEAFPHAAVSTLAILPPDVRTQIDPEHIRYIGYAIIVTGIIARYIKQPKLQSEPRRDDGDKAL